jgi:hypothetical protein
MPLPSTCVCTRLNMERAYGAGGKQIKKIKREKTAIKPRSFFLFGAGYYQVASPVLEEELAKHLPKAYY